jgi:hypothetical protein
VSADTAARRLDGTGIVRVARERVVARIREAEVVAAALSAGRNVLLEGPPGTGKPTLLRAPADGAGVPLVLVEGNAELTPARLVGHHDASRVLTEDYRPENFVPGPLTRAMTDGAVLYVEEFNRVPEETMNVLPGVLSEREMHVPRYGRVTARPTSSPTSGAGRVMSWGEPDRRRGAAPPAATRRSRLRWRTRTRSSSCSELARSRAATRDVLLLSDGVPTESPDPLPAATALVRAGAHLHVLSLSADPESKAGCAALAAVGGGRVAPFLRATAAPAAVRAVLG